MTHAIRKVVKNGIEGYQVVQFNLNTYFCQNGYKADELDVDGAFFEEVEDAENELMNLEEDQ
jgi:hypothetical protein